MMGLLQRTFRGKPGTPLDYEASKRLCVSTHSGDRRHVAQHSSVRPELLYFLAHDTDPSVRAAVAANEATPVQADVILAHDPATSVREDLAHKIARLAPGLTAQEHDRLRRLTYEVLEVLVSDQVSKVRRILADTLKDIADAPPDIVQRLARDCDIAVAGPVLQFSPVLTDADLLEIIGNNPIPGARDAIARRDDVRETVSEAIGNSGDLSAVTALLANPCAQIREEMLDHLIDMAPGILPWHAPLVHRPSLPSKAARRLARFVATSLLSVLRERRDLDPDTTREIADIVMSRIAAEEEQGAAKDVDPIAPATARARKLQAEGKLDDAAINDAIDLGDRYFLRAALALLATLPLDDVDRVLAAHSAKGIVALAWKAGLKMQTALRLETGFAHIPRPSLVRPQPDGSYPLTQEAMRWQLEFLTGTADVLTGAR
jgi:uncharacterized protein (DUF2336 family)